MTGDQSAIPFAFGTPDSRAIYINLGTGAFIQRPLLQRPADPAPLLASVLGLTQGTAWYYCLEGSVNGAGSAIDAFAAQAQADQTSLWAQLERLPAGARVLVSGGLATAQSLRAAGAPPALRRFEPQQLSAAGRAELAARRVRFEARLRAGD